MTAPIRMSRWKCPSAKARFNWHTQSRSGRQSASVRAQIRSSLTPTGSPQLLLELGVVRSSHATGRRPARDLTTGEAR